MEGLGTHLIAELFDCNELHLNDVKKVEEVMMAAAELSSATIIKPFFHKFSPYGISGVIVIAESHFTIHTWPEYGYAAVDVFTCGDLECQKALDYIKAELEADRCSIFQFQRGILAGTERLRGISAFREVENAGYVE
ncbi:MAG TPA: adenosylmethionine decarboxylase [Spirochaetota bacterium]|nr:adenosylmethionine decarboxylase [Spirochaetota bacterium]OPZ39495.1 MAG: S-adenosylmethionine decarboxylase proenzyme precursor [Spirochaetes bacterium ADurb.BinA120]HNU92343.1 adenosylmethionine decarboxylase [Spirochaetota bacterium]HPI15495.1 adenosylmethionine decarboxylase [Spirochaetota bacterium]HPO46865.1 adenosylmethionine decarboxylase [Spirochaetota bacterium]